MKKNLFYTFIMSLLCGGYTYAQPFSVQHSVVDIVSNGFNYGQNGIIVPPTSGNVTLTWKVIASDFPADWIAGTGFCDNMACYFLNNSWPSGNVRAPMPYAAGTTGGFTYSINLANATSYGTYFVTVEFTSTDKIYIGHETITIHTATETYIVTRSKYHISPWLINWIVDIFPNPAREELNIHFSPAQHADNTDNAEPDNYPKTVNIYNVVGQLVLSSPISSSSEDNATVDISKLPFGSYIVHLVDGLGSIIASNKFVHE